MSTPRISWAEWRAVAARSVQRALRAATRIAADLFRRAYALALIILIFWVSARAIAYLVGSLMIPAPAPAQIIGLPKRLDEQLLHGARPDWLALRAVENPRSPLSHYHRFDSWLQTDALNDCTRSGCHGPLPHARSKELRAFLNMHATSIHCGVCHMQHDQTPMSLTWYDLKDGRPAAPPALLAAYGWLLARSAAPGAPLEKREQQAIVALLREAARQAGGDPALERIAEHIWALAPRNEAMPALLSSAQAITARSVRGLYSRKLAIRDGGGEPILAHPNTKRAVDAYFAAAETANDAQRAALLAAVHPLRRESPHDCLSCHREEGSLIDYAALGYPPARVRSLYNPAIFQMMEHIGRGEPFYMPQFNAPPRAFESRSIPPVQPESTSP